MTNAPAAAGRRRRVTGWGALLCAVLAAVPATAQAQTLTFGPVADTYSRADLPTSSSGGSLTVLKVDADPINNSYLRFDVEGLQGPVTGATLRMFPTNAANVRGVDLRRVADNSWSETALTFNSAPAASATIASHVGAYDSNVPIVLDAKPLVSGNGPVSMAITTTSTASRSFSSRESSTNRPQLIVAASDVTAPVVGVTTPADGGSTNSATPTFSGSAGTLPGDSSAITVRVYAGSGAFGLPIQTLSATQANGAWSAVAPTPLVGGTYTVRAEQADADGNVGASAPHTFAVDPSAPVVVLDAIGNDGWTSDTTPALGGVAGTAAGDAGTVRVRVYRGQSTSGTALQTATATVAADGAWTVTPPSVLAEGAYTVQAEQADAAGNVGLSETRAVIVDTTAAAPSLTDPEPDEVTEDSTPTVGGTAGTSPGDSDTIGIEVYAGTAASGTPETRFDVPQSDGSWSADVPAPLSTGKYTVLARQSDAAGNVGVTASRTFAIEPDAAPVVTLTRPLEGASVATATPVFRGRAGTVPGDASTVTLSVFSGAGAGGTLVESIPAAVASDGSWSVTASPALDEGTYTAQAAQSDSSGHTGTSASVTFTVDLTPPDSEIDSKPSDPAVSSSASFSFHASEAGSLFQCNVDGGSYDPCTSGSSLTGLADGRHDFAVRAVDAAGNVDPTPAQFAWTIDASTPAVTLTAPVDDSSSINPSPTFSGGAGTAVGDADTVTVKVYDGTATSGTVVQSSSTTQSGGSWSAAASSPLPEGRYTAQAEQRDSAGNTGRSTPVTFSIAAPVIAAAGDIACDPLNTSYKGGNGGSSSCRQKATSDLLVNQDLAAVLGLGDLQYYCSGYDALLQSYDVSWGRVKAITFPAVGNHEYDTSGGTDCDSTGNATGFFRYWGSRAGDPAKGYYSFDVGSWHIVALNSNTGCQNVACNLGSPQEQWLKADLAAHPNRCTLAYWHAPRFSSGGSATSTTQLWKDLYAAGADVVLNGHVHNYERFLPQDPSGNPDAARGIREFVVGTGGASHGSFSTFLATSEVHDNTAYGVLKLTLHADRYDWQFVPEAGKAFEDAGSGACH